MSENIFTAHKSDSKIDVYHVPSGPQGGWTRVYLDHGYNGITYFGDYISGSSNFYLDNGETLKGFLLKLDFQYFMKKTRPGKYRVFDPDATIEGCIKEVRQARRCGKINKATARHLYDEIGKHSSFDISSFSELIEELHEIDGIWDVFEALDDIAEFYHDCPICRRFWEGPWQALCALWREELECPEVVA